MTISSQLATIPLFEGLTDSQYDQLSKIIVSRKYNRGQTIFSEGDEATGFFVVAEGTVKIFKLSMDGKEQILHIFGPGEPFAEVAVFTGSTFPAHAEALKKSTFFFVPRKEFISLIHENPSMAMNMMASMSMRLKKFAMMIEDLSLKEVPNRLAAHFLYLSAQNNDSKEFQLNISKSQLASLMGTVPETLSRILSRMSSQNFVSIHGSKITVHDSSGLRALADGETKLG